MDKCGDEGSWFRLEPAFKFRTIGSRIAYGDSVRFASVKFEQHIHVSLKRYLQRLGCLGEPRKGIEH